MRCDDPELRRGHRILRKYPGIQLRTEVASYLSKGRNMTYWLELKLKYGPLGLNFELTQTLKEKLTGKA